MSVSLLNVLHDSICGGVAAAGFGVLFNVGLRTLPWCAVSGALGLATRTVALAFGLGFEASSFLSALTVGIAVQLVPTSAGVSRNVLHVVGCIPMTPGAFAARAFLGLFAVAQSSSVANDTLLSSISYGLRVVFTVGALGTGLAIPSVLFRSRHTAY